MFTEYRSVMKRGIYYLFVISVLPISAYLSASRDGLSVTELEDLLSLSDEVLQDTYIYHLPPNDKHIRIPPSIISQMMTDVKPYVIVRKVGPFKILSWFHRQFKEVSIIYPD